MSKQIWRRITSLAMSIIMLLSWIPVLEIPVFAASVSDIPEALGISISYGDNGGCTVNSTSPLSVTLTINGTGSCNGGSSRSSDITITNTSDVAQTLSFKYDGTIVNNGEFWENGTQKMTVNESSKSTKSISASTVNVNLKAAESYTFKLVSGKGKDSVVTLNLQNITTTTIATNEITFLPAEGGSYTADGNAVTEETKIGKVDIPVTATAASGYTFLGWVDESTGRAFSLKANDTITFAESATVKPLFVSNSSTTPWFLAAGNHLVNDLNTAVNIVKSGAGNSYIVLKTSGILPAGNYEIPQGVNMLLPYSSAELFRGAPMEWVLEDFNITGSAFPEPPEPSIIGGAVWSSTPNVEYCRLTMAEGTHITVNGSLEVSGQTHPLASGQWGNYAVLQMESNTSITVGSTGTLYAYGYIRGNGTVTVESKGVVYEHYDVANYPPGGAGGLDPMNTAGVFGLTDYTFNNVEVPTTYYTGAELRAYLVMTGYAIGTNAFTRTFIGSDDNAVFSLKNGTMTMGLVGGRQKLSVASDLELNRLYINIKKTVLGVEAVNYTVDSSTGSGLPLSHNWDVTVTDNSTVTLNGSLLMYAGSTVTVNNGSKIVIPSGIKMSLLDPESDPSTDTANSVLNLNGEIQVDGGFYTSYSGTNVPVIKSSEGTGKVTANAVGTETTFNVRASGDETATVNVTPATLQNEFTDNGALTAQTATGETGAYHYDAAHKRWTKGGHVVTDVVTAPSCQAEGYTTHTCTCGYVAIDSQTAIVRCADTDPLDGICDMCSAILCAHPNKAAIGEAKEPNCTDKGITAGEKCTDCGAIIVAQEEIPALGHNYTVTGYEWTEDNSKVTARGVCANDETHTATLDSEKVENQTTDATCMAKGSIVYTATFAANTEWANLETQIAEVVLEIDSNAHADENKDHICDHGCGKKDIGTHADTTGDGNHICDYCSSTEVLTNCTFSTVWSQDAANHWHDCTECGADSDIAAHADADANHLCDACTYKVSECVDSDKNHDCDLIGCDQTMGNCADADKDHTCDYGCDKYFGTCEDADKDHDCDYGCSKVYGIHEDTNNDHICEYGCSKMIGVCEDGNKDHDCDYGCGKTYGTCEDNDRNHTCDYGCSKVHGTCGDADKDHDCDYGCGLKYGTCADTNKDHKCDYGAESETGCRKYFDKHEDSTGDGDHACDYCNAKITECTEGEAKKENIKAPTCTADGSHDDVWYCTECNAELRRVKDVVDKALGHAYTSQVTKQATCKEEGVTTYTCANDANHTYEETIEKLPHTEKILPAVAPTCTETGLTAGVKCDTCGEVLKAQNVVDALGHKEETVPGKDATCEATGLTDGVKCSVCQETLTAQDTIPALGHAYTSQVTKPATCKEEGITTYTCGRDANHFYTETIEKLPHTEEVIPAVAPTCTNTGLTAGTKCAVCGEILEAQNVEAALGHDWDEGTITTPPTCSEPGVKTYTCKRTNCGTTYTESVSALGHTEVTIPAVDPTCEDTGWTAGVKCDVCGEILTAPTEVPVLGHDWGEGTVTTPAECTKEGVTTYTCQRENCGMTKTESIAALGHDWTALDGICGRCETACEHNFDAETHVCVTCGYECEHPSYEDGKCTVCGYGCPHEFVEGDTIDPTCEKDGYTIYTCSICAYEEKRDIVAAGHKYNSVVTAPTCTEAGYTTHTCSGCGDTYKDTEVAALGHEYNSVVTDPTCTEDGYTTHTCSTCGHTYTDGSVAARGHTYNAVVTAPTCIEEGYTTYTCHCGHSYVDNKVEANGHTPGETVVVDKVDPDCTNPGSHDNVVYCTACNAELSRETITVPALGHKYGDWVTEENASCTTEGKKSKTCGNCGDVQYDSIPIKEHEWSGWTTEKEATCTEDGSKTRSCNTCSKVETNVIPAAGHKYQVTEVIVPTCSSDGFTTYTCSTCGDSKTGDNVSKLGHTDVIDEPVAPSCTETGLTEGSHCSVCGKITKAQEVISATGHTSGEVKKENEVPATCTNPGSYNEVTYCSVCGEVSSCTTVTVPALNHKDENKDHICDNGCGESQGEHIAASGSHNCGYCGEKVSGCTDNNGDHNCDVCGEKLSNCADKIGDEDHKCDICGEDDITAHEWTPATYDAPKTCTECGKTLGDPLVRPVEIVKPEYVTAEPSEGISKEEVEEAMSSVIDSIVEAAQKTEQPETGINAEKNKTAVENAKTEIKDKDQNVVTDANYETSLVITLNAVVLDKDEENVITKKITFDVSPILYALDANGTKIGQTKITSFAEPITFRLPVAENAKAKFARVLHEGVDDLGLYKILTDADGNRFVEVKSKNFSQFSLVLEEECTDHNFVDGKCTICGAEEPVTLVDFAGTTMTLGNSLAMNFVIDTALLNGTDHYAVITKTYADKSPISKTIQQADWNVYDGTLYYFAFDDIAAKEMGDKLTVIVYRNDGTQVSVVRKDSVYDYAMRMLVKEEAKASPNPEKLTLYVDMLNYGAAAQTEFEYSLHTLVNRDLTEAQQAYATNYMDISDSRIKGNGYAGSTLTLKSNIILNFVFNKTVVSKDMYAIATYKNHYGYDKNVRIEGDKFVEYDDARWYIPVSGMVVADCSSLVTITIYNADGTIVTSAADSVESYVARMSSAKPLYLAIIKFGLAAYASFH